LCGVSDSCFGTAPKANELKSSFPEIASKELSALMRVNETDQEGRMLFMRRIAFMSLVVCLFAGLATAQVPTSGNVFLGYSFENTDWSGLGSGLTRPNLSGWEASLEGKIFPHIGIVADLSGHYGSENLGVLPVQPAGTSAENISVTGHELEVLFGPRVSIPIGKFTPFAEAFFGVAHIHNGGALPSSANTSFGTALGGGLDYKIIRPIGVRMEADYVQTRFFSATQDNFRFSTGVVVHF
jgi:opacity protein-like surface antigen